MSVKQNVALFQRGKLVKIELVSVGSVCSGVGDVLQAVADKTTANSANRTTSVFFIIHSLSFAFLVIRLTVIDPTDQRTRLRCGHETFDLLQRRRRS